MDSILKQGSLTVRQELAQNVMGTEHVDFVGQHEFLGLGVEDGLASSDTSVVDLEVKASVMAVI